MSPAASRETPSPGGSGGLKRRRITRACDRCHRSGVKCAPSADPNICGPCAAFGSECTYVRPVKRRGPVPRAVAVRGEPTQSPTSVRHESWSYEGLTSPDVIEHLVEAYHRIVYPMLPYFHWPSFIADVRSQRYMKERAFFATVMAVCAISAARIRDGAGGASESRDIKSPDTPPEAPASELFYDAAKRAFPSNLANAPEFDYKRAKVLLAMLCIQYGHVRELTTNLGDYMSLCATDGFHNEARWPPNLRETELQERRRVYWGAYSVDVYSATTWGLVVRHREAQSTVLYPAEVYDDDEITEMGIVPRKEGPRVSWLIGWNFTNDLYRILEHSLDQLRQRRNPNDTSAVSALYANRTGPSPAEVLSVVDELYTNLPPQFKEAKAMTGNIDEDRFGFQAADIIVTLQTVKMVMMALSDSTVEQRCAVAGELLDALSTVPTAYIQAISSPILHHLAGVGHLLGGVIQSPLSHWTYLQVRNVLLAMADLLSNLESTMSFVPGIAEKLRDHVSRIDAYMTAAALDRSRRTQVFHSALPASAWSSGHQPTGPMDSNVRTNTSESPQSRTTVPPETRWPTTSPVAVLPLPIQPPQEYMAAPGLVGDLLKINPPPMPADGQQHQQFQLPEDLLVDWPFDMSEAFDFLGSVQA